jgi:hypothetical protein
MQPIGGYKYSGISGGGIGGGIGGSGIGGGEYSYSNN